MKEKEHEFSKQEKNYFIMFGIFAGLILGFKVYSDVRTTKMTKMYNKI